MSDNIYWVDFDTMEQFMTDVSGWRPDEDADLCDVLITRTKGHRFNGGRKAKLYIR